MREIHNGGDAMTTTLFSSGRRVLIALILFSPALAGTAPEPAPKEEPKMEKLWIYVGTYTGGGSKGIYRFELDPGTGKLSGKALAAETVNPSFLALHPSRRFLYAVSEVATAAGKTGGISAFALDPKTGDLTLLNQQASGGGGPCHVVVDKQGKAVLAANYGGGSACALSIQADGKLGQANVVQHKGSSVNKQRQEAPHAHSVNLDPANHYAFVADLGLDKVMVYKFDPDKATLTPNDPPAAEVAPGAGPRHFAFHPSGRFAYVINEMQSTVTAFTYDAEKGVLKSIQTISTLPADFKGNNSTAEVQVHPSGKFLYGSNRGHNSIAVFAIDDQTGQLKAVGHQGEQIKTPRNFGMDPTGTFMLVANQDGDSIVVFRIDPKSGQLTPTGNVAAVPKPVCVKIIPKG
jgi:6-phosphogluconolactonase